ncbi:MAG: hypothetical protein WAT70_11530 [Rhizobiaceae bacterium]
MAAPSGTKPGETGKTSVKQAVIVIHGMGEQRPMETLRALVGGLYAPTAAAWSQKRRLKSATATASNAGSSAVMRTLQSTGSTILRTLAGTGNPSETDQYWIVPDARAGSHELSRIRTRPHTVGGRTYSTDFYELYYADLLSGNTLSHLTGWIKGLLLRWPHQVPKSEWKLWVALWFIAIMAIILLGPELANNPVQRFMALLSDGKGEPGPWGTLAVVAVGVLGSWSLVDRWRRHVDDPLREPAGSELSPFWSLLAAIALPVALAFALYAWFPWGVFRIPDATRSNVLWSSWLFAPFFLLWGWPVAKLAIGFALYRAIHGFGVPIFGDVARYVRPEPAYVASRHAIRERGLKLMESVHGAKKKDASGKDTEEPEYYRVIIVAHSLGSIIALDLLRLCWASKGPGQGQAVTTAESEALSKVDALYQWAIGPGRSPEKAGAGFAAPQGLDLSAFHAAQREAAEALRSGSRQWRITDFVTLGSPLTHAEFLVARDRPRFEAMKAERMIPTCPPLQEGSPGKASFLYTHPTGGPARPHHAAVFASVRFTAIFDPAKRYVFGDFIGGPMVENLGAGVVEFPVRIRKPGLLKRVFTHTSYWNPLATASYGGSDSGKLPDGLNDAANDPESAHLAALRALIWLQESRTGAIRQTATGGTAP